MRILSVDPGSRRTGLAIIEYSATAPPIGVFAETFNVDDAIKSKQYIIDMHGERFCRIVTIQEQFTKLINAYSPNLIACESCYYAGNPNAFQALSEIIQSLKVMLFNIDRSKHFKLVPPSVVKNLNGVNGGSGDKELVREAVTKYNIAGLDLSKLDEHAIDAIAINLACNKLIDIVEVI